jgi:hypothetical protein
MPTQDRAHQEPARYVPSKEALGDVSRQGPSAKAYAGAPLETAGDHAGQKPADSSV